MRKTITFLLLFFTCSFANGQSDSLNIIQNLGDSIIGKWLLVHSNCSKKDTITVRQERYAANSEIKEQEILLIFNIGGIFNYVQTQNGKEIVNWTGEWKVELKTSSGVTYPCISIYPSANFKMKFGGVIDEINSNVLRTYKNKCYQTFRRQ